MSWPFITFMAAAVAASACAATCTIMAVRAYHRRNVIPVGDIGSSLSAEDKAWVRLRQALSKDEWSRLQTTGSFRVRGGNSGHEYHISATHYVTNIRCPAEGRKYCLHLISPHVGPWISPDHVLGSVLGPLVHSFPLADHLLAQALMIRNDEATFKQIAARW